MHKKKMLTAITLFSTVLLAVLFLLSWIQSQNAKQDEAVYHTCSEFTTILDETDFSSLASSYQSPAPHLLSSEISLHAAPVPSTAIGQELYRTYYNSLDFPSHSKPSREGSTATVNISVSAVSFDNLQTTLNSALQSALEDKLLAAPVSTDIYNANLTFREDVAKELFFELLTSFLQNQITSEITVATCSLSRGDDKTGWFFSDCDALEHLIGASDFDFDSYGNTLFETAFLSLTYVRKEYGLPLDSHVGPVPDATGFQSSDDIEDVFAMLDSPYALQLLNGREPFFKRDLAFMPNQPFRWYLDESILAIVWKEVTAGCAGTYSEIVLSSGTQFCRKIVDDTLYKSRYVPATSLAREANAVLALGGDIYAHPDRRIGIQVYEGVVTAYDDSSCDTCMFTADGDMIFTYRNQFETQEEAQAFVDENNVRFSMAFGPVIIEDGKNVAPVAYQWGEIYDTYARASIGMKDGPLHYLSVNINEDGPAYWNLATLQDEIDAMLAHGCTKAYAMDGGQTCCTILNGQLLNRVQFNRERDTSDIIFFATAIPVTEQNTNEEMK